MLLAFGCAVSMLPEYLLSRPGRIQTNVAGLRADLAHVSLKNASSAMMDDEEPPHPARN